MDEAKTPAANGEAAPIPPPDEDTTIPAIGSALMGLLERAREGDKGSRKAIETIVDDPFCGPIMVKAFGDLAGGAELHLVDRMTRGDFAGKAAIPRKMKSLRAELEGPSPGPIERLLAERAAYCWLVLWRYEGLLADAGDLTLRQSEFHQRRIDAAHRRYLSSLRTLAAVRKLALPAVQVNIAENQVNVAGP